MSKSAAIVLVHGFWGGAAHLGKVITELAGRGYNSLHAVDMPPISLADDASSRSGQQGAQHSVQHRTAGRGGGHPPLA